MESRWTKEDGVIALFMMTNNGQHFLFGPPEDFDVSNKQPVNTEIFEFNQYKLLVGLGGLRHHESHKIVKLLAYSVDMLCIQRDHHHLDSSDSTVTYSIPSDRLSLTEDVGYEKYTEEIHLESP